MDDGGNLRYGDLYSVHTNKFEDIERYKNHKWDTFISYEELPIKEHYKIGEIKAKYVIHMQVGKPIKQDKCIKIVDGDNVYISCTCGCVVKVDARYSSWFELCPKCGVKIIRK